MNQPRRLRRRVIASILGGAAGLSGCMAAGFAIAASAGGLGGTPVTGRPLVDPPLRRAVDGVLSTTLEARASATHIAGRRVVSDVYEGLYTPPTLMVRGGDTLRIVDRNRLADEPTNLHIHGMHVSPSGHGDNVFVNVPGGSTFRNEYRIPENHLPGMYWYHPHRHMYVDDQVYGGMAGALIVKGSIDDLPGIAGRRDRIMVLQRSQVGEDGRVVPAGSADETKMRTYINGQLQPVIDIRPGEVQRWRIANAQADDFVRLSLDRQYFWVIGTDGSPEDRPIATKTMLVPPGGRREVLVVGGAPGTTALRTLAWGTDFQKVTPAVLATVRSEGTPVTGQGIPGHLYDLPDLRDERVARRRNVEFSADFSNANAPRWLINGRHFDQWGNEDLFRMKRGSVEEWTLTNTTTEYHPFHIHVNPFQVTKINGKAVKGVDYRDTMPIPPGGSITIRSRFADFTGRFVIHCHILFHEDHGMMAPVRVVA